MNHALTPRATVDANGDIPPGPPNTKGEGHVTYGFGRRLCVSQYVADNSLFINIAALLWATKIECEKDALSQLIPFDLDRFEDHGLVVLATESRLIPVIRRKLWVTMTSTDIRAP
jgi:hypothetical protein